MAKLSPLLEKQMMLFNRSADQSAEICADAIREQADQSLFTSRIRVSEPCTRMHHTYNLTLDTDLRVEILSGMDVFQDKGQRRGDWPAIE